MFEMKKSTKDNIGFVIVIASIVAVVSLVWVGISSLAPPDREQMEKYFKKDNADIMLITEFLIDSEHLEISISKNFQKEGYMFAGVNLRDIKIEDEAVVKAVNRLFNRRGYRVIEKRYGTISFEKWAMFEKDRGIVYSINGKDEPTLPYLTKLEPLSKTGWYYYEEDYNEWRQDN